MSHRAVFFDRDDTLMVNVPYLGDPAQVVTFSDAAAALADLSAAGFLLFVVSNQSGVGRGLISREQVDSVNVEMTRQLGSNYIHTFYHSYAAPDDPYATDRKPSPEIIFKAAKEHDLDLSQSYFVGDRLSDVECGRAAGCRTILLTHEKSSRRDENSDEDRAARKKADHIAEGLASAAQWILNVSGEKSGLMKALIVIPARYGATRFPGKSLALLSGRPMIQWVWEAASRSRLAGRVVVATDDRRIARAVAKFGAEVAMTKKSHRSGTDRMAEVAGKIPAQLYVNVQGDEPLLSPGAVDDLIRSMLADPRVPVGTLAHRVETEAEWRSPEVVKAVCNRQGEALYFSRSPLPFQRAFNPKARLLRHVGIYAFRARALAAFVSLPPSPLEIAEGLEQLRALEHGLTIRVIETKYRCLGVDTPADLARVEKALRAKRRKP